MCQGIALSEIKFDQLVINALDAFFLLRNNEIIYLNSAACKLLKVNSYDDLTNKNFHHYLHPDFHYICTKRLQRIKENKEPAKLMDQKFLTQDRDVIDVEVMGIPYEHKEGEIWAQIVCRDISKRLSIKKRLHEAEKRSVIGELSAGIVHEIKNPLTSVKGFVKLLKNDITHSYLDIIDNELDDALTTLESLLHISRPDLNDEPHFQLSLNQMFDDIMLLFQDQLYNVNNVTVERQDHGKLVIKGKRNLLKKAFFNLIKNAFESIEDKGRIVIKLIQDSHWNYVTISDSGVGIPRDKLSKLGTPFFTTKINGTGMGLTQVFNTIEHHHGHVDVSSKPGVGTTFTIRLPLV